MRNIFLFIVLISSSLAAVAQTGSISGTVIDGATKEPIIGANVIILGTQTGVATDIDGKFVLTNIKEGAYSIVITFITYKTDTIRNIEVTSGQTVTVASELNEEAKQLTEVVVQAQRDRSLESTLMLDRKNAVQMVQGIGAQELSRKGVSDAEAAVTQITGITKQDGVKNVFVRGLGDRYNSTSLNGLPLPSEDPQNKNITLDLFSSDIIGAIDVNKTFNSDMFGDVAGANINIKSKQLVDDQELKVSLSGGMNSQTAGENFYRADGTNYFGTASRDIPVTNLTHYGFNNSFQPKKISGAPLNSGISISGGKSFRLGDNVFKVFLVGATSSEFFVNDVTERQQGEGGIAKDLKSKKNEYYASQLGMGNFSYSFGQGNSISYNAIYIHDNKQSVADYIGFNNKGNDDVEDPNAYKGFIRRQQQNNNATLVNQLLSELTISKSMALDLGGSYNTAWGDEPDRRQNFYLFDGTNYRINAGSQSYNHRFNSSLKENELAGRAILTYKLSEKSNNKISVGYNLRSTHRDFESLQFNFKFDNQEIISINNPDALFNQQSIDNGIFELETANGNSFSPFTYSGERVIHAGFLSATFDLSSALTVNGGIRFEKFNQKVIWDTNISDGKADVTKNFFLPSVNVKYSFSKDDILRLASSRTYTFAQFKELAPFLYEDINFSSFGNPYIRPSENTNVDLRYEHYFSASEFIALTVFYKGIKNPINRGLVSSAANEVSYFNTLSANIFGAEVEFRKSIFDRANANGRTSLDFGLSVSYLKSSQTLKDVKWDKLFVQYTNAESQLEGASPWLVNSDITFTRETSSSSKFVSTILFNYNTSRIYSLGAPGNGRGQGSQDINDVAIPKLDFISSYDFNSHLSIGVRIKNLLNPDCRKTKEIKSESREVVISDYQKGITTSLSLSYKF